MTRDITPDLRYLRLFFTRPHKCSYLAEQQAITSFVDPSLPISTGLHSQLSRMGFRRSGKFFYAPSCSNCQACIACRIVVDDFRPGRNFRRTMKKNNHLSVTLARHIDLDEHYRVFETYIEQRHHDGDMYPASVEQYIEFLGEGTECTRYLEFRHEGTLVGCSVVDFLDDGLSAIYTYFLPELERQSLGTFAILTQVEMARARDLPYVYLGYWIEGCQKMSYKDRFQPLEIYTGNRWQRQTLSPETEIRPVKIR